VVEVFSCPGEFDPLPSLHELIPGPLAPSEQLKLVGTD
jgi:hypothetical protein